MPALQRESCSGPFRAVPGCCARGVGMDVTSSEVTATTHSAELRFFLIAVARSPVHSELLGTWGYYLFLPASERCPKAIQSPGSPAPRLRPPRQQAATSGTPRATPWSRERAGSVCFPCLFLRGLKAVQRSPKRRPEQGGFLGSEAPFLLRLWEQKPLTWAGPPLAAGRGADTGPSTRGTSQWRKGPRALGALFTPPTLMLEQTERQPLALCGGHGAPALCGPKAWLPPACAWPPALSPATSAPAF